MFNVAVFPSPTFTQTELHTFLFSLSLSAFAETDVSRQRVSATLYLFILVFFLLLLYVLYIFRRFLWYLGNRKFKYRIKSFVCVLAPPVQTKNGQTCIKLKRNSLSRLTAVQFVCFVCHVSGYLLRHRVTEQFWCKCRVTFGSFWSFLLP